MDSRRDPPFSPPSQRWGVGTITLVLCAVLAALYLGGREWTLRHHAASVPRPVQPAPQNAPSPAPSPLSAQNPAPNPSPRKITKCVDHGKTSYSDRGCAPTAVATPVHARTDLNLMDAPRPPSEPPAQALVASPYPPVAAIPGNSPQPDTATLCKQLEAQISYWDDMARQPQTGQTQDWIRSQRQRARDAQFRIPCR